MTKDQRVVAVGAADAGEAFLQVAALQKGLQAGAREMKKLHAEILAVDGKSGDLSGANKAAKR